MTDPAKQSIEDFCKSLLVEKTTRVCFVWNAEKNRLESSHPRFLPLAERIASSARDFDQHEGIFLQLGPKTRVLQGAFVHRTCRGQGAGGVRFHRYENLLDYLKDGLRLSMGMTHKNALAGIWWGGGKGVMAKPTAQVDRVQLYEEYGEFMSSLKGCYVTAEDVGTSVQDMAAVFSKTRFTTCIPETLGGSGNPSVPTARGALKGMQAALHHLGLGDLKGKRVAVQGLGHVGAPLVAFLFEAGVQKIFGADTNEAALQNLRNQFGDRPLELRCTSDDWIFEQAVDIVAPCAVGGVLNPRTIQALRAPIVCGAANNQLADPRADDVLLAEKGVLYLPDFLVNRMGIVTCADEAAGYVAHDPLIESHLDNSHKDGIYQLAKRVLEEAKESGKTPQQIALQLANARSFEPHPIFGHRGQKIIHSLFESGWY